MPRPRIVEVQIPGQPYVLYARWPASDLHILHTVVRRGEYAPLDGYFDGTREVLFLDLGANIGAASRYFLNRYPKSRVIAVEPDSANIEMYWRNLEPYRDRIRLIQAAVWSCNTTLVFDEESTQAGTEAGIRLHEPANGGEAADGIRGIDIPTLLAECDSSATVQIVVKMDVEGSEAAIFGNSNLEWLDRVCCMAIELHDHVNPDCSNNFYRAMQGRMRGAPRKISETLFVAFDNGLRSATDEKTAATQSATAGS